jgi:hypothetical protein
VIKPLWIVSDDSVKYSKWLCLNFISGIISLMENDNKTTPNTDMQNSNEGFSIPVNSSPAPKVSDFTSSTNFSTPTPFLTEPTKMPAATPVTNAPADLSSDKQNDPMHQVKPNLSAPIHGPSFNKEKSKILTIVLGLIILLVVVGGVYGIYSWQHSKVNTLTSDNTALSADVTSLQSQLSSTNQKLALLESTATTSSTIKFTTLGISISLPSALKDLVFTDNASPAKLTVNGASVTPISVNLSSASLTNLDSACSTANAALGVLSKTTGTYPATPTTANSSGTLIKQYSTYYIAYTSPAACSKTTTTNTTQSSLVSDLKTALNNITVL